MNLEKKVLYVMQMFIITFAFIYITSITFMTLPPTGLDHSKTVLGFILGTVLGTLLTYNWGTSKGSVDKTEAAEKRLDAAAGTPTEGGPAVTQKKTETTETTMVSKPQEEKGGAV